MKFLKNLGTAVLNYIKNSAKLKSISKEDIIDILNMNIDAHRIIKTTLSSLTPKNLKDLIRRYDENKDSQRRLKTKDLINFLKKELRGEARKLEDKKDLGAYLHTNNMFISIQADILKKIDKVMIEKELTIFNTRVTFVSLLGLLRQSEMYSTYLTYLVDQVFTIANNPRTTLPKYREKYLLDNKEEFIRVTNSICNKRANYSFLTEIENVRKKNANLLLYSNGNTIDTFANASNYTKTVSSFITSGIPALNVFLWVGEMVDDYKHNRYLKNKHLKEWLESHVAHLRFQLAEMDPDDPKAIKLEKIIEAHDSKIAEYDEKLSKYLEED